MSKKRSGREGEANTNTKRHASDELLRCLIIASLSGVVSIIIVLSLLSASLALGGLPIGIIRGSGVVVGAIGAFVAGYICSRINRKNGLFLGLACAAILFVVIVLASISVTGQSPGIFSLIKLFSMLLCGAVGGSLGVNAKSQKPKPRSFAK